MMLVQRLRARVEVVQACSEQQAARRLEMILEHSG
jgi:hypothetical protein